MLSYRLFVIGYWATVATALRAVRTRLTETRLQLTDTGKTETLRSATIHYSPIANC